jgi:hypothetical protein
VHTCGVTTTGEGLCWGYNDSAQADVPTGKTWASVTAGKYHSCGVTTSGEGLCWGGDQHGDTAVPTGKTWASISAGSEHTCGVTTIGEGLCWGHDGYEAGYGYDYDENGDYTSTPQDYYTPAVPADGRLDVPAGKVWFAPPLAAPRLTSLVGLRVNPRTKVSTLVLKAASDTSQGDNPLTKLEYWNHTNRPKDSAAPKPSFVRAYAPTVSLRPGQVAFWVRVKDSKGKWSIWYRTRFKPGGTGW